MQQRLCSSVNLKELPMQHVHVLADLTLRNSFFRFSSEHDPQTAAAAAPACMVTAMLFHAFGCCIICQVTAPTYTRILPILFVPVATASVVGPFTAVRVATTAAGGAAHVITVALTTS
jgi:hypothetical protein